MNQLDPLTDPRWGAFVHAHKQSSVFHSSPWLKALHQTYGFIPLVYTTSSPGQDLQDGVVFCRLNSWFTGRRLISLPYSDHCELLTREPEYLSLLLGELNTRIEQEGLRYVELRPLQAMAANSPLCLAAESHVLHTLDLTPSLPVLFSSFHSSSTKRKIRRAERSGLTYSSGRSNELLSQFYRLLVLTRRRHGLPPQPRLWFQNLIACFGDALTIRVASLEGRPVASILTIRHKDCLVYKYGCADRRFFPFGGMHLLLWNAIQESKQEGVSLMDLGRSEAAHHGLITFKDRWGATRQPLTYFRLVPPSRAGRGYNGGKPIQNRHWARRAISHLPNWVLNPLGRILYRHLA